MSRRFFVKVVLRLVSSVTKGVPLTGSDIRCSGVSWRMAHAVSIMSAGTQSCPQAFKEELKYHIFWVYVG